MHKKVIILLVLCLAVVCSLFCIQAVFADSCGGVNTSVLSCGDNEEKAIYHIIKVIIDILSVGVGIVGVIGISWVGIRYLTSGGDSQKATKARSRLFEICIGLALYALLYGVIVWLLPGGVPDLDTAEGNTATKTETTSNTSSSSASISSSKALAGASKELSSTSRTSSSSQSSSSKKSSSSSKKAIPATVSEKNRGNMIKLGKDGKNVTIVGDSITWRTRKAGGFKAKLKKADIYCYPGKRTFNSQKGYGGTAGNGRESGDAIITSLIAKKKLRPIVVIALGTNDGGAAALTVSKMQGLVNKINADGKHSIYFVTNYKKNKPKYYKNNNAVLSKMQEKNKNVMVIDWAKNVGKNPEKYMVDSLHPKNGVGTKLFANTIYRALAGE